MFEAGVSYSISSGFVLRMSQKLLHRNRNNYVKTIKSLTLLVEDTEIPVQLQWYSC